MTAFPKCLVSSPHFASKSILLASVKRSVQQIFTVLLLMALAVTLSSPLLVRRAGDASNRGLQPPDRVFNSTLIDYAATDLSLAQMRRDIDLLLEGTSKSSHGFHVPPRWRRFHVRDLTSSPLQFSRQWTDCRRNLNIWRRGTLYDAEIMNELANLVVNRSFNSCAVVGNSGILLQEEHGSLIDSHDVVIRLNNARTAGFESHVGSKTSISFINSNILHQCSRRNGCACQPYGAGVSTVMYLCQAIHLLDYSICKPTHTATLLVTDARFDALCARIVKYYSAKRFVEETGRAAEEWGKIHDDRLFHYSSGMQAVMLAVGMCRRVGMFGFGKSASAKHHYHTDQKEELQLHDYKAEFQLYSDLVSDPMAVPFIPRSFSFPSVSLHI